jgi:hypothetical protein
LVGANGEGSGSTGVNGDENDTNAPGSGATFVYELDTSPGVAPYGTGSPGCAGPQSLGANHAPMVNSPHFANTCDHAPPSSLGLCLVADAQDAAGSDPFGVGVLLHVNVFTATEVLAFDVVSDGSGNALTVSTAIPNNAALVGKTYFAQAIWVWTTCPLPPRA